MYEVILLSIRQKNNYDSRMYYHKAHYSLDCNDGIDCLSHATLENLIQGNSEAYKVDSRLSLSRDFDLAHYLQQHTYITELVFCLDNDDAGRKRAICLAREYADKDYYTRLELPTLKDYNEVLLDYHKRNGGQL